MHRLFLKTSRGIGRPFGNEGILALVAVLLLTTFLHSRAQAQSATRGGPKFDVVSVKENRSGKDGWAAPPPSHGAFTGTNTTLMMLITSAYRIQNAQVIGGPKWLNSARFDINAKGAETASTAELLEMLQNLLADRFKLVIRREVRESPIYNLVVSSKGPKLGKPEEGNCADAVKEGKPCGNLGMLKNGLVAVNMPMDVIASTLGKILGDRMVVDKTGLTGKYDLRVYWQLEDAKRPPSSEESNVAFEAPSSAFSALEEQAGLKLEPARGNVPVLVIESAQMPDPN